MTRILSLALILAILYTVAVFFFPKEADTYGNKEVNTYIRNIKTWADSFSASQDPYLNKE
ncbi:hypothetical protein CSB09_02315 [Candidatus Gracilibacteria bacterium]|nr:MAG: hypothetical protein CSB09_02315 [Candidatus Gracilibacteria bacterium]